MTNNHAQVGVRLINSINHYGKHHYRVYVTELSAVCHIEDLYIDAFLNFLKMLKILFSFIYLKQLTDRNTSFASKVPRTIDLLAIAINLSITIEM